MIYYNCGIKELLKYNIVWTFDKIMQDYYSFTHHVYLTEYERLNGIK